MLRGVGTGINVDDDVDDDIKDKGWIIGKIRKGTLITCGITISGNLITITNE